MSEGYFPEGEPADQEIDHQAIVRDKIKGIAKLHESVPEDDIVGQYEIIAALEELMPYSTSLILAKGELLELLAASEDDTYNANAKECYERVLKLEPNNANAKYNLGSFYLNIEDRPDLARPLLDEAMQEFKNSYYDAAIAHERCG
jgi:tetratricopeptide (TPR) repeat protein